MLLFLVGAALSTIGAVLGTLPFARTAAVIVGLAVWTAGNASTNSRCGRARRAGGAVARRGHLQAAGLLAMAADDERAAVSRACSPVTGREGGDVRRPPVGRAPWRVRTA
jgi:hypothetical protein